MSNLQLIEFSINSNIEEGLALGYYFKKYSQHNDQISESIRDHFKVNDVTHVNFWSDIAATALEDYFSGAELHIDHVVRALGSSELQATGQSPLDTLCKAIAESLQSSYSTDLLHKSHATRPLKQTNMRSEREEELDGVYKISEGIIGSSDTILLVDDISTSGTTSKIIAQEIKTKYPNVEIYFFVLAKTSNPAYGSPSTNSVELFSAAIASGVCSKGSVDNSDTETEKKYSYAIGIDLGTTNSLLSYKKLGGDSGMIEFLSIDQPTPSQRISTDVLCPSVVYYNQKSGQQYVGKGAEDKKYTSVLGINVFYSSKSQLGQKVIYQNSKNPDILYPYQVSSKIIEYLLKEFIKKVHNTLDDCKVVVTVPASFGGSQRLDTIKAISEVGIPVTENDLVDEPNAAFVGYISQVSNKNIPNGSRVLIFDMGGGTTDISIVELLDSQPGAYDVRNLAISRYDLIGGDDIDYHIATEFLLPQLLKQNNINMGEWSYSVREKLVMSKLRKIAKGLKELLSAQIMDHIRQIQGSDLNSIPWDEIPEGIDILVTMPDESLKVQKKQYSLSDIAMTGEKFSELISPFIEPDGILNNRKDEYNIISIFTLLSSLEEVSSIPPESIDYLLFVGGSTLNPHIIDAVHKYYSDSEILTYSDYEDVDRIVSLGAVTFAEQLANQTPLPIIPIVPDKIGILIRGREFIPIIPGGVEVPFPIAEGDYKYCDPLNLPSTKGSVVQIPICIGTANRIYQTIQIPRLKIEGEVLIGFRISPGKTLECEIKHAGEPISFELNNPISVYSSDDIRINNLHQALFEHRNAVVNKLPGKSRKTLSLVEAYISAKKYPQAKEYAKSLLRTETDNEIKAQALFKLAYTSSGQESIEYYGKYLKLRPNSSVASFNLGLSYSRIGNFEKTEDLWKKSIDGEYASNYTYVALANLLKNKGESYIEEAELGVRKLKTDINESNFDDAAYYWLIKGYELLEDSQLANEWKMKRDIYFENKNKVYDEDTLLEVGLLGVDEL